VQKQPCRLPVCWCLLPLNRTTSSRVVGSLERYTVSKMNYRDKLDKRKTRKECLLQPPTFVSLFEIEYSIHYVPQQLDKETLKIFPSLLVQDLASLLVVPTWQKTKYDLASFGPEIEEEKTRCLENFLRLGNIFVHQITSQGYWADYIDPCSGYPMHSTRGSLVFHDIEFIPLILGYPTFTMGMCTLISHPKWRTATYPATIFTTAPVETVQNFFQKDFVRHTVYCPSV
jgi:hypothetical protein